MNVPKIRFKEFNDEYKKVKFGDIVNYQKGFAFKSKDYKNSGVRIIRISDTTNNSIKNDNAIYINKEEAVKHKNVELITDDIMISSVGSKPPLYDSMVGKVVLIPEFINGSLLNQNAIRFRTKQDNQKYIYNYLKQRKYTRFIENIMRGNANQRSITLEDLFEFELNIPSLNEQNKVSKLLSLLNKKIELQSKKIEDLKLFKSSQIINFFNKNNFAEVNIKNIGFFQSGNSLSKDCLTSSGVPIILYGDLYTKYNEVIKKVEQYTNDNKKYVKSKQNQIIFPTSTTVNSLSLISPSSINLGGIIYGGDILILNLNKDVNADFLSYEINHYKKKEFSKIAQGSTIIHIYAEDLLNCKIALPNIVLQNKFALTFNKLNQKIELENNKLNKLQKLKKGLMQVMFV